MSLQEQFDDAMFEFSTGHCDAALEGLKRILAEDPNYFDAQLALGGAAVAEAISGPPAGRQERATGNRDGLAHRAAVAHPLCVFAREQSEAAEDGSEFSDAAAEELSDQ